MQYLENTLVKLLATRPACLLLPSTWTRYGPLLQTLAERRNHPQITHAIEKLEERNIRLLQTSKSITSTPQTISGRVYRVLDAVNYNSPVRIDDLSYECMEILSDAPKLVAIVTHWACSCYREGTHRVFLATRLLRKWSHLGADVYEGIISYLRGMSWVGTGDLGNIFKIVAELVRSKTFAVGRYLQWLIATGSLGSSENTSSVRVCLLVTNFYNV